MKDLDQKLIAVCEDYLIECYDEILFADIPEGRLSYLKAEAAKTEAILAQLDPEWASEA